MAIESLLALREVNMEELRTPQMIGDTVVQLEVNFLAPVCNIRIVHALHEHGPRVSMVCGGAFWLWVRLGVEGPSY
jgi:hypothetical protein